MKKSKILSTVVAIFMLMSAVVVVAGVENVKLSKNGLESNASFRLTCGELIKFEVKNNSLNASERYYPKVWNGTHWRALYTDDDKTYSTTDKYGDFSAYIHVPGWTELAKDPLSNAGDTDLLNGRYNISLFDDDGTQVAWINVTIAIGNLIDVRMKLGSTYVDNLVYDTYYSNLTFEFRNWTGNGGWEDDDTGETFNVSLLKPDWTVEESGTNIGADAWAPHFGINESDYSTGNLERYYWLNLTNYADGSFFSNISIPVKLVMDDLTYPSSITWGDTFTITGDLTDGSGDDFSYEYVRVYAPTNGGYEMVKSDDTYSDGEFDFTIETGSGHTGNAGTWYIGTYKADDSYPRINETDVLDIPGFIAYDSFTVKTYDTVDVKIQSTDIISGFNQTFNISVYNESIMENDEYKNMKIHVTGLEGYWDMDRDGTPEEYDADDIVEMTETSNFLTKTKVTDHWQYYTFNYRFNETGTATILVSYPGNKTSIAKNSVAGVDSYYSDTYDNYDLLPNLEGSETLTVESPADMNLIVEGDMVQYVPIVESTSTKWYNGSSYFILNVYGATEDDDDRMNATLEITGCGLDILINESDTPAENEYLNHKLWDKDSGQYNVTISPKTGGILTIKATNESNNYTATKDYTIYGATGSVTTSVGDDLEITVGTSESITVTLSDGTQWADVVLTYFNEDWGGMTAVNDTTGDGTAGNGLDGIYTFTPHEDDLDAIGYIVVVAKTRTSYYLYDIVEIVPVHDIDVTITTPTEGNQTLTVGMESDLYVQCKDPNGEVIDDIDQVTCTVKDEDGTTLQTFSLSEAGDYWKVDDQIIWYAGTITIKAKNNTATGDVHDGTATIEADYATITFTPSGITCAINLANQTIAIKGVDALGNPLPKNTRLYRWIDDAGGTTTSKTYVDLDANGEGELKITATGDVEGKINMTLQNNLPATGNRTLGELLISFPQFVIDPETIYIGQSNLVTITAKDANGDVIEGINLTLFGAIAVQPDPRETDSDGKVIFSLQPESSGVINVTIARNVTWTNGALTWTNDVITDSYITITSLQPLTITVSKTPIYEGETLIVTVKSGESPVQNVGVTFGTVTEKTGADGTATFEVPDPGVDSAIYDIEAEKTGYTTATKSITVINKWDISIIAPSGKIEQGKEYTFTIVAKGQPLAGATVTLNGKTYTSGGDGKVTITVPDKTGEYTITATFPNYIDGELTLTVKSASGTPGFELLTLVIALGVAFILLRRRRR